MKKSQDFVIQKLKSLFETINGVKIRYEYRDYLSAHIIEILPLDMFENSHEYQLAELSIQDEFEELYGSEEEILFISSDSLNEISDVQFSLGYEIIKQRFETSTFTLHSFKSIDLDYLVNEVPSNTSYALAA